MASGPSAACLAAERELQAAYVLAAAIQQRQPMSELAATSLAFEVLEELRSSGLDVAPTPDAANDDRVDVAVPPVKSAAQFLAEFSNAESAVSKPLGLLLRIATRQLAADDLETMAVGASSWFEEGMQGHCADRMGLPRPLAHYGAEARNAALLAYAYQVGHITRQSVDAIRWDTVGKAIEAEWSEFLGSALWPRWKREGGPSWLASEARRLLFWASTFNDGEALSYARIRDVLKKFIGVPSG